MTVDELIEELRKYPGTYPVFVDGYEGGYDELTKEKIKRVFAKRLPRPAPFYGTHDDPRFGIGSPPENALLLSRLEWPE